jgi:hypothetical protein
MLLLPHLQKCLGPLASKPLLQLAHVDCLDQIQAYSKLTHAQTCYIQCLSTRQLPMMDLVAKIIQNFFIKTILLIIRPLSEK